MNVNFNIVGPDWLPKEIDKQEYNELLVDLKKLGYEELLTKVYRKSKKGNSYELDNSTSEDDRTQLWDHYAAINMSKWIKQVNVDIAAYYIYKHRMKFERKGDQDDDHRKAEYLVDLVKYLNQRNSIVIWLRQDNKMEEIIDQVNNIFDSAYFRKLNRPDLTDTECFFEAEREFCEYRKIDFLAHQYQLNPDLAEILQVKQEIAVLAYENFEWRKETGEPGDEKSDWTIAEREHPVWRMKKRIATICWNLSTDKHKHQDFYWSQACAVMAILDARSISYVNVDPYEPSIYNCILEYLGLLTR